MRSLILLRLLADKLTNEELQSVISQFIQLYGPKFVLKAIFNEFAKLLIELQYDLHPTQQYSCHCGEPLSLSKHKGDDTKCNECKKSIPKDKTFWHCDKEKNTPIGSDICTACIKINHKNISPIFRINTFNKIISDVIHSRQLNTDIKIDSSSVESDFSVKLDTLPPELISQFASFLPMQSYFALEQTNRRLHVGCSTPFSLYLFDTLKFGCTLPINWYRFKSIKSLCITSPNMEDFNELFENNASVFFNKIKQLTIDYEYLCLSEQLNSFVATKCINFSRIEKLSLLNIGNKQSKFNVYDMIKFLSLFTGLKSLDLHHIFASNFEAANNSEVPLTLPHLTHIKRSYMNDTLWNLLVNISAEQLISLDCYDCSIVRNTIPLFKCLRKLHIRDVNTVEFIPNNKNLRSLEEMYIDGMESMECENIEKEIVNLMTCQKQLNHIKIRNSYDTIEIMFQSVESALFQIRNEEKDLFKISFVLDVGCDGNINRKYITDRISKLLLQIGCCEKIKNVCVNCHLIADVHKNPSLFVDDTYNFDHLKKNYKVKLYNNSNFEGFSISNL